MVEVLQGEKAEWGETTPVLRTTPPREGNFEGEGIYSFCPHPNPLPEGEGN